MKILPFALSSLTTLLLITGCDRSNPAPEPEVAPAEESIPALTDAALERLILDTLSATSEESDSAGDAKISLETLPQAQRKTLNDAVSKAVSKIDFKALLTSIASNLEVDGIDLSNLPGNMQVSTRVLTPAEAEKMGISFKNLNAKGEQSEASESGTPSVAANIQIVTIGSEGDLPFLEGTSDNDKGAENSGSGIEVQKFSAMEVNEDSDPERSSRIQSHLESGDSDALADEIADLIQSGIDFATLQQAMGDEASSAP